MSKLIPVFVGVPVENSPLSSRVNAMLGRGLGRGAPAGGLPTSHGVPEAAPAAPPPQPAPAGGAPPALPPEFLDYIEAMGQNIAFLREQLGEVRGELSALNGRGSDSQRVFEALHDELNDYKRDFIYEHMKPLLRPLLFLYDSLDSFDQEMKLYEDNQRGQTLAADALQGTKVRQNLAFLRDQLIQALSVCEVEPLPIPTGAFDPKQQKAIDTAPVAPELDGTIINVIRIGWTMHGHLLRPAEVVLGKNNSHPARHASDEGQSQ